jgi:isoleucyl-tRNA synthetase
MSQTPGNTVDPFELFDKYGADATRWYLITNSPPWRPTLFDEDGLVEAQRKFFGTLMNTYAFFALYANIDKFSFKENLVPYEERPEIDRWIISMLGSLVTDYQSYMDEYDVTRAARAVSAFTIDQLSNWYVRRSRRRFWSKRTPAEKSEMNRNKLSAYQTLNECLVTVAKLTAPFAPFVAEEIYRNLNSATGKEKFESVHLSDFPKVSYLNKELEAKMDVAQRVVTLTRAMRAKHNLKVRQPLSKMMVVVDSAKRAALEEMKNVILEEVNIKELVILKDDSDIVNKSAKPNFKSIGPKFGKNSNKIAGKIREFNKEQIAEVEKGEANIEISGEKFSVSREDVEIISSEIKGWLVESEEGVTVAIDTELDNNLISEGLAREFVNRIQNMRKDSGFEVTDKIKIEFNGSDKLIDAVNSFKEYVSNETLAEELTQNESINGQFGQQWNIGEYSCSIRIIKVK